MEFLFCQNQLHLLIILRLLWTIRKIVAIPITIRVRFKTMTIMAILICLFSSLHTCKYEDTCIRYEECKLAKRTITSILIKRKLQSFRTDR